MSEETVYLTDIEIQLIKVFTDRKILNNKTIIHSLIDLVSKLEK